MIESGLFFFLKNVGPIGRAVVVRHVRKLLKKALLGLEMLNLEL